MNLADYLLEGQSPPKNAAVAGARKVKSLVALMLLIALVDGCRDLGMRRDVPFQEIIPMNGGIAVVNSQKWFVKDLSVRYSAGEASDRKASFDRNGFCYLPDLANGREYTVIVSRTDIKGRLLYRDLRATVTPTKRGSDYYVLVGASVGRSWEFEKLPDRQNLRPHVRFGNRTVYRFDKTDAIKDLAALPVPVAAVVIKECAAYFPRDVEESRKDIAGWVHMLRRQEKRPVLATVVPVTRAHDSRYPGRLASILQYNDFIREFAEQEGLQVLDLEKALRRSDSDRSLRSDYAQEDGLHLVKRAYDDVLDQLALSLVGEF